jgi:N-acylneuraminate cytidylyltransferase/CMP-N,N'-diacetyllegionaminic acid synthase
MFILGTICCRGGSKGVPGKNVKILNGKPLIAYTIETANHCSLLNDVIVSTDSQLIADTAKQYNAKVPFIRPTEFATDAASKWPVFVHALETYEKLNNVHVDYLVDIDVTVPLKTAADIDGAIQMAINNPDADVVITGYEPEKNPYFNMMEIDENGFAAVVKKSPKPIVRRQDATPVFGLSGAAFVVKRSALYEFEHWSTAKCMIYEMPRERAVDIDTDVDFKIIEFLMNHK